MRRRRRRCGGRARVGWQCRTWCRRRCWLAACHSRARRGCTARHPGRAGRSSRLRWHARASRDECSGQRCLATPGAEQALRGTTRHTHAGKPDSRHPPGAKEAREHERAVHTTRKRTDPGDTTDPRTARTRVIDEDLDRFRSARHPYIVGAREQFLSPTGGNSPKAKKPPPFSRPGR
jgi:hypothetical protein